MLTLWPQNIKVLTVAAVFPSVSDWTVTGERLPAHSASSPILTWVGLTEREFSTATCKYNKNQIITNTTNNNTNNYSWFENIIMDRKHWPGSVPLLAINPARSTALLSTCRSFMQPINSLVPKGKLSGTLGTPPRNNGPVRSKDLRKEDNKERENKVERKEWGLKYRNIYQGWGEGWKKGV